MIGLLLALASAEEPCAEPLSQVPAALSVVWVSPLRRRAFGRTSLAVFSAVELRNWLGAEADEPSLARMLQHLGLRRSQKAPKRAYKVVVFEAGGADLCRPLIGYASELPVDGLRTCADRFNKTTRQHGGCGYAVDRVDGSRGPDLYRIRWRDAAHRGFCVIPAERFIVEGAR